MTPRSTPVPYCPQALLLVYHDWQQVADLVRDGDAPRPTQAEVSTNSGAGTIVYRALLAASGELESACIAGKRYAPADLSGLTGAGLELLQATVAHLAFWRLAQRRQPISADPSRVPGALQALQLLQMLRDGERIFPTDEAADAGLPADVDTTRNNPNRCRRVVSVARRFFGIRSDDYSGIY